MFFDALMLARAATECEARFLEARVREPLQTRHDEIILDFRRDARPSALLLSSSPQFGRVCLTEAPRGRGQPQPFGLALRKQLKGARLRRTSQPGLDRILRLEFEECEGFGPESQRTLVAEIMGKHGNIMLLDEHETILSCAKHVPARMNRYRQIMEGEQYIPPPGAEKLDPRELSVEALLPAISDEPEAGVRELLHRHCLGISKVFSAEVLQRTGTVPKRVGDMSEGEVGRLVSHVVDLTEEAARIGPSVVYERPEGTDLPRRFAYPMLLECCGPPIAEQPHLGAALDLVVQGEVEERRARELRQRVEGAARAQLKDLTRRADKLRAKVAKAERAQEKRKLGELLLSQPHAAQGYSTEVELVDYYAEGAPTVTVTLDPPGDLTGTAQRLFDQYKRAARILERVPPLVGKVEAEVDYLEAVLAEVELAESVEGLEAVEEELTEQGYLRAKQKDTRPPGRSRRSRHAPKSRASSDGYTLLYGTNHFQNDELVKAAAPDDLWLHVQGAPGAHVLVRASGDPESVPRRTLVEAAQLAARWSRLRKQDLVDVDYTRAKHVRKAKGARPGMVFYTHQKTVTVRLSESD